MTKQSQFLITTINPATYTINPQQTKDEIAPRQPLLPLLCCCHSRPTAQTPTPAGGGIQAEISKVGGKSGASYDFWGKDWREVLGRTRDEEAAELAELQRRRDGPGATGGLSNNWREIVISRSTTEGRPPPAKASRL